MRSSASAARVQLSPTILTVLLLSKPCRISRAQHSGAGRVALRCEEAVMRACVALNGLPALLPLLPLLPLQQHGSSASSCPLAPAAALRLPARSPEEAGGAGIARTSFCVADSKDGVACALRAQ